MVVGSACALLTACDATVGLDTTRSTFTDLLVPGACRLNDDLSVTRISAMMLLDGREAILPTDKLRRQPMPVGDLINAGDFGFNLPQSRPIETDKEAIVERASGAPTEGVGLQINEVGYHWSGGEERSRDGRLVVFLMDSSSSLIGENARTSDLKLELATDLADERITFFRELLGMLPEEDWVSLLWFNGSFPTLHDDRESGISYSRPTRNRDVINDGLTELSLKETGTTPLAAGLDLTMKSLIDENRDLNSVVIMFTDGVEERDASTDVTIEQVTELYEQHDPPIPVIVLELQPDEATGFHTGRSRELVELACRTGGEYLFLEKASNFSGAKRLPIVRNRITGTWWLTVTTTLGGSDFGPDEYLLSSELSLTLDGKSRAAPLVRSREDERSEEFRDTRLWFYK